MERQGKKKIYFGWIVLATSFMIMMLQYSTSIQLGGLFLDPVSAEFGVTRSAASLMLTLTTMAGMLGFLFAGRMLSKMNIRLLMSVCFLLVSGCFAVSAFTNSMTVLYIVSAVRGVLNSFLTTLPVTIVLGNWFGNRMIGKVYGMALVGGSIGSVVLSPITGYIIGQFGRRGGYLFFAALPLVLIPLVLLTYYRTPEEKGFTRIGDAEYESDELKESSRENEGVSVKEAVKSASFRLAISAMLFTGALSQSWFNNGPAYLADVGFDAFSVSGIFSAVAVGNLFGRLVLGWIIDKFGIKRGFLAGGLISIGGFLLIVVGQQSIVTIIGSALLGFGTAIAALGVSLVTNDLFGRKDFGTITSYMNIAASLGASIIPLLLTAVYDIGGSYVPAWFMMIGFTVLLLVLIHLAFRFSIFKKREK